MAERNFLSGSVAEARSVGRKLWARSMGDMSGSLKEKSGPGSTSAAPGGKTDGVTAAQREAFHETFVMFDVDGGGTIDASELSAVMQSLGHDPSEEELDQMIAEVRTTHHRSCVLGWIGQYQGWVETAAMRLVP